MVNMAAIPVKQYSDLESYQQNLGCLLGGLLNPEQTPEVVGDWIRFRPKSCFSAFRSSLPIKEACLALIRKNARFATCDEVEALGDRLHFSSIEKGPLEERILDIKRRTLQRKIDSQEKFLSLQAAQIRTNHSVLSQCTTIAVSSLGALRDSMRNADIVLLSADGSRVSAHLDIIQSGVPALRASWEQSMLEGASSISSAFPLRVDYSRVNGATKKSLELFVDFQYGKGIPKGLAVREYIDFIAFARHLKYFSLVKKILGEMTRLKDPIAERQILRTMASKSFYFEVDFDWPILENWLLHSSQWRKSVDRNLVEELENLEEGGKKGALILLGLMDLRGILEDQEVFRAARVLRAAGPIPLAQALLAEAYKKLDRKNESMELAFLAAHGRSSLGEVFVGRCCQCGWGVEKDSGQAILWYQRAADKNNSQALLELSRCYESGFGVSRDDFLAYQFAQRSAKRGDSDGIAREADCLDQGIGVDEDPERALALFRSLAEREDAYALARVGEFFEMGRGGERLDPRNAFNFYLQSAAKNCSYGIVRVGLSFQRGIGVARDLDKAVQNFQRAAEMENSDGQYYLGQCHENKAIADGTIEQAKAWYQRAAANGNQKAKRALERF